MLGDVEKIVMVQNILKGSHSHMQNTGLHDERPQMPGGGEGEKYRFFTLKARRGNNFGRMLKKGYF